MIPHEIHDIAQCPVRGVIARMGDKWSILILLHLAHQDMRFHMLRRAIPDISQRVLTATLRKHERDGLVWRSILATVPPQVTYGLTPIGKSLIPILRNLADWAVEQQPRINEARAIWDSSGRDLA